MYSKTRYIAYSEDAMASWTLELPDKLTFDEIHRVQVKIVEGSVSVVASDDLPTWSCRS